jgi:hypothetical protein
VMSSERHCVKEIIQGSLSSEDVYAPLSQVLHIGMAHAFPFPLEISNLVIGELLESITIDTLEVICMICSQKPTAPMLAIALQNSIPSLTGLPMDNPDPGFYIDIAKRFFGPVNLPIRIRTEMYDALQPTRYVGSLINRDNIEAPHGFFSSGLSYYVHIVLYSRDLIHTKKGRDFIKGIALEWLQTPLLHDAMVKAYTHLINVLDHGLVLRYRNLEPGCIGQLMHNSIQNDEHL